MHKSETLEQLTCNYMFLGLELNRKPQRTKSRCNKIIINICSTIFRYFARFLQVCFFSILSIKNKYKKGSLCLNRENTTMNSPVSVATAMAHEHFG